MPNQQYKEPQQLNLPEIENDIRQFWDDNNIFKKSIESRDADNTFVFYEGPPSANGKPGIHHVLSRAIKDIFCRFRTQQGYRVERKGGWDTHGLPVEIQVENELGITKEDIGNKISVADYNERCRKDVLQYKDRWDELTRIMGFWLDLETPYITFDRNYIESVWYLLKQLYEKGFLYKGYTIQPFSPAAGTQLSSHELNMPGCYKEVKDTSVTAQFKVQGTDNEYLLAWTTTPWTLPSNTALAVGANITYVKVKTFNQYTGDPIQVYLAKDLLYEFFKSGNENRELNEYQEGDKEIPWQVVDEYQGAAMEGWRYEQLLPYAQPEDGDAFKVILGDFVTTEEGTGIVHIAPSFGADDMRVAGKAGLGSLTLVDHTGKFTEEMGEFAGRYVKNYQDDPDYEPVDVDIAVKLKKENKAFKVEKYEHSYPHCWRTDKPILYYPMDSWFIKATAAKDRMVELNKTINWKPPSTGEGRFGNWLENLVDWNLSRSRYWGTPLPIWRTEDQQEEKCIGSFEELKKEVDRAVEYGYMEQTLPDDFDPHHPYVGEIVLVSPSGKEMVHEKDLIDVWFDSGAMPYAQWHYPFDNQDTFQKNYPADFIAEGVDQTRGWFYTLHAIATMLFDSVAYKNVVSNGLVLDKNGNKMSKRLGNVIDPFETIQTYGADATRWYMIANAQPWDNLKFDLKGLEETQRKFFGTLFNTYSFFAMYANIDGFRYEEEEVPMAERNEIDQWIISRLNTLVNEVRQDYEDYEPTKVTRNIQHFVDRHLSNWYVRLSRRRFWKGDYSTDKIAAYQTLYTCMDTLAKIMAPVAPFFADYLFRNLNHVTGKDSHESVHLSFFPEPQQDVIDTKLEERMKMAQDISSMVLSLRKQENIKVRQPLNKILIPILREEQKEQIKAVENLILSEVNVKEIEYVSDTSGVVKKTAKPDFKKLGPKLGKQMKEAKQVISDLPQDKLEQLESEGSLTLPLSDGNYELQLDEVEIVSEDIPGWLVATEEGLTLALDITITGELENEGNAREFVNKIQRLRKEKHFDVTDRISVRVENQDVVQPAINHFKNYICKETLADELEIVNSMTDGISVEINEKAVNVEVLKKN